MKKLSLIVILAAGAAAVAALLFYQPLETGSTSGRDEVNLIEFVDESDDESATFVYRYEPGGDYFTLASLRNTGPLPLTIVGPDPAEMPASDPTVHALLWADEFRLARGADPGVRPFDARLAPSASGSVIPAEEEVLVWVHWRMGNSCPEGRPAYIPGSGISVDQLDVAWTVFGLPRVSPVSLGYEVSVMNPGDDAVPGCAE